MNHTTTRMPFGKHAGKRLSEIDSGYLCWLVAQDSIRQRHPSLVLEAETVLDQRTGSRPEAGRADCIIIPKSSFASWFRKLTARFHPDKGVDPTVMLALNTARDELLSLEVPDER